MKIGVITVYNSCNYGSYLQAYALKQVLNEMGHEVYHIKIKTEKEFRQGFYKYPVTRRSLSHPVEEFQKYQFGIKKFDLFQKAIQEEFQEIEKENARKLDCIIIGSDELWNIKEPELKRPEHFGNGFPESITYGISVGRAEFSDFSENPEYRQFIQEVSRITVRDKKTKEIVEKITGKTVPMVCDPVFLVPMKQLYRRFEDDYLQKNPYILVYSYNFTIQDWTRDYLIRYAKEKKLKLVSAGFFFSWCDYNVNCQPKEFNDVIRRANCMVTTTFHGSILGTLNHQNILAAPFSQKVNDVMEKLGMSDRIISEQDSYDDFKRKLENNAVDYNMLNQRVEGMRSESLKILKDSLKEKS